jgi:hypothetical protein
METRNNIAINKIIDMIYSAFNTVILF